MGPNINCVIIKLQRDMYHNFSFTLTHTVRCWHFLLLKATVPNKLLKKEKKEYKKGGPAKSIIRRRRLMDGNPIEKEAPATFREEREKSYYFCIVRSRKTTYILPSSRRSTLPLRSQQV